jgi:hypothetical protein
VVVIVVVVDTVEVAVKEAVRDYNCFNGHGLDVWMCTLRLLTFISDRC